MSGNDRAVARRGLGSGRQHGGDGEDPAGATRARPGKADQCGLWQRGPSWGSGLESQKGQGSCATPAGLPKPTPEGRLSPRVSQTQGLPDPSGWVPLTSQHPPQTPRPCSYTASTRCVSAGPGGCLLGGQTPTLCLVRGIPRAGRASRDPWTQPCSSCQAPQRCPPGLCPRAGRPRLAMSLDVPTPAGGRQRPSQQPEGGACLVLCPHSRLRSDSGFAGPPGDVCSRVSRQTGLAGEAEGNDFTPEGRRRRGRGRPGAGRATPGTSTPAGTSGSAAAPAARSAT